MSILASCMANFMLCFILVPLSLYSSTRTHLKGTCAKPLIILSKKKKFSLLSPWRKRCPPQHIKHIRNTRVSRIPTVDELCSPTLHPLNFVTVVFLVWVPNSGAILHKRANQRTHQVATQKRKLEFSLVWQGCNVF